MGLSSRRQKGPTPKWVASASRKGGHGLAGFMSYHFIAFFVLFLSSHSLFGPWLYCQHAPLPYMEGKSPLEGDGSFCQRASYDDAAHSFRHVPAVSRRRPAVGSAIATLAVGQTRSASDAAPPQLLPLSNRESAPQGRVARRRSCGLLAASPGRWLHQRRRHPDPLFSEHVS